MAVNPAKVIVGSPEKPCRSSFMFCRSLTEPTEEQKAKNPKATATGSSAFLFSKKDKGTYKKVMAAIKAAGKKKFGDKFNPSSRKYSIAIRDGNELYEDEDYSVGEEAKGMWFISTKCYKVPQLVDQHNQRVIDPDAVDDMMCSGNYFLPSITFKAFDNESKGVRAELNNLMYIKEGERLDGSSSAESDFEEYAVDPDDYDEDDDDDDDDEDEAPRRSRKKSKKSKRRSRRR